MHELNMQPALMTAADLMRKVRLEALVNTMQAWAAAIDAYSRLGCAELEKDEATQPVCLTLVEDAHRQLSFAAKRLSWVEKQMDPDWRPYRTGVGTEPVGEDDE